jgi:hypothetical protein
MNQTLSSAPLSSVGFPPSTYRLGAGVVPPSECLEMLRAGMACPLAITNKHGQTGWYWLSVLTDGKGTTLGYRLLVDGPDGIMYDIPADLGSCECPDHCFRGVACKHIRCIRSMKQRGLLS